MPKPICVIYFPHDFPANGRKSWIYEYMRYLNGEQTDGSIKWDGRKEYWNEYYWFCFYKEEITEPELQVIHEKDFTEMQFQELKELVLSSIPK